MDVVLARIGGNSSTPAAVVLKPTLMVILKMLPPATVTAKYADVVNNVDAIKKTEVYAHALAMVRGLSGAPTTTTGVGVSVPAPVLINVGPPVTVDISADGLISSLKILFSDAMLRAVPMTGEMYQRNYHSKFLKFFVRLIVEIGQPSDAKIIRCANAAFGDYQCNNAMALAKALKTSPCGYSGI